MLKSSVEGRSREDPKRQKLEHTEGAFGNGKAAGMSAEDSLTEPMAVNGNGSEIVIDEDLHSRQLAVYGRETMRKMFASNVLISGLNGLGVEIAKNVILAGIKSVTLHDTETVIMPHLSAQFYLSESDVGKNRAAACAGKLQELNKAVAVTVLTEDLTEGMLGDFQAVVFTDLPLDQALQFNAYCHSHSPPVPFIRAETRGVFGAIFTDFGRGFVVADVDGEEPFTGIIASIANDSPAALVTCIEDERLGFEDGDLVVLSEVRGMEQLNDGKPRRVRNVKANSFVLEEDTSAMGAYEGGGIVTQVKQAKTLDFRPLDAVVREPGEFLLSDFAKFDRPPLLHLAFQALDKFRAEKGSLPAPNSTEDADRLVALVKEVNASAPAACRLEEVNEGVIRALAHGSTAEISPMAAMFGGIVGQEVVKACSGKFHPLFQLFYFDAMECLPADPLPASETTPAPHPGSRYDSQLILFGRSLQRRLQEANLFVVGAGALGCEFLKILALMGACSPEKEGEGEGGAGSKGLLTVTDDDVIEKSNLSRQFLFRDWNIGQAKSTVAAAAARAINPRLRCTALQNRVSPQTETAFDDAFWEGLDVVVNALDNVVARLYVDSRCLYFQRPLLESGTLGPKCNTQIVVPHETENYGASRDPPERSAPMCTLHSFPHNIMHCLTWARSEFEGLLDRTPSEANSYLEEPAKYCEEMSAAGDAATREQLERVVECLVGERCSSFEDCLTWARSKYEDYFANRVKQLTFTFPEDAVTSSGTPFWSAPKRFPRALTFDASEPSSLSFVTAAAILRAETYGIARPDWATDPARVAKVLANVAVPEFAPKKGVKIVTDERATSAASNVGDDAGAIADLIARLTAGTKNLPAGFRMAPVQFEKDDDTNFHMDLIASLANLRARNYSIAEVDKLKAKFIAGRIIPAIATTTALACGLVTLELYKVLQGFKVDRLRNTFANLALPLFSMAEPVPPKRVEFGGESWSAWDRWIIEGDITVQQLLDWFQAKKLDAYSISCGQALLFNSMFPRHKERLTRKVSEVAAEVAKLDLSTPRRYIDLVAACEDEEGEDLDVPLISIRYK